MNDRSRRDYIRKLLEASLMLQKLALSLDISYEKSQEIQEQHHEIYNKWLFCKKLNDEVIKMRNK